MSHIRMLCEFELGRMVKDVPVVDIRLSEARLIRQRDPWELVAVFPPATPSGTYTQRDGKEVQEGMRCTGFIIELAGDSESADAVELAFHEVLDLARDVADTIWVSQHTQGFAGSDPLIVRHELEVDGSSQRFVLAEQHGDGAMYPGFPMPSLEELRQAVEDGMRPSMARMLLAQATRWGMAEHFASKSAALLLAASACEVSIKSAVSSDPDNSLGSLAGALDPPGRQAPLSPAALLEHVLPLVFGRSIEDDFPDAVGHYKKLTKERDQIVHQGKQLTQDQLQPHLNAAREVVEWVEGRLA